MTTLTDLKAQLEQAQQEMNEIKARWDAFEKEHEAIFAAREDFKLDYRRAAVVVNSLAGAVTSLLERVLVTEGGNGES